MALISHDQFPGLSLALNCFEPCSTSFTALHRCYFPQTPRESVSPVCRIFSFDLFLSAIYITDCLRKSKIEQYLFNKSTNNFFLLILDDSLRKFSLNGFNIHLNIYFDNSIFSHIMVRSLRGKYKKKCVPKTF